MGYRSLLCALSLLPALTGCGGGDFSFWISVSLGHNQSASGEYVTLNGTAFAPQGTVCTSYAGTCSCSIGTPALGQWRNTTTGASGLLTLGVNAQNFCATPDAVWWSALIPLSFGNNLIVITLSDSRTQTSTNITVTRN